MDPSFKLFFCINKIIDTKKKKKKKKKKNKKKKIKIK